MTKKKNLWKAFGLCLCAVMVNTACSDENDMEPDYEIPIWSSNTNIVEPSDFADYIDWKTYAGNNFYRYATGAWQDRTTIKPGESKGTIQEQIKLVNAYINKMCTEGGNADFARLFQAYSKDNQAVDRNKVCQKLADIDANVNTKEQAWKKMAQLIREGYWAPLDFSVWPVGRKVYPALISSNNAWSTNLQTIQYYIEDQKEAAYCFAVGVTMSSFFNTADLPNNKFTGDRQCCEDLDIVLMGTDCRNLTRSSVAPDDTPVGMIIKELNLGDDSGLAIHKGYKDLNEILEKFSIEQLKHLMKYCVIDRDHFFVAHSNSNINKVMKYLILLKNSPVSLILSKHYSQTEVPAENKARVMEMAEHLRSTFMKRLERNNWLNAASKIKAKEKLQKMYIFLGWPEQWNSDLDIKVSDAPGMDTYDLICDLYKQRVVKQRDILTGKTDKDNMLQAIFF